MRMILVHSFSGLASGTIMSLTDDEPTVSVDELDSNTNVIYCLGCTSQYVRSPDTTRVYETLGGAAQEDLDRARALVEKAEQDGRVCYRKADADAEPTWQPLIDLLATKGIVITVDDELGSVLSTPNDSYQASALIARQAALQGCELVRMH